MELKKFQFGVFVLRTIELNFRQCHILVLIVFSMLTWGAQAQAANPSLTFKNGWIGEYSTGGGGNPHQPDNVYAFRGSSQSTIAIESVTISQESATGLFVKSPQGNDVPVTLTIRFVDSTKAPVTTSAALVNWRSPGQLAQQWWQPEGFIRGYFFNRTQRCC